MLLSLSLDLSERADNCPIKKHLRGTAALLQAVRLSFSNPGGGNGVDVWNLNSWGRMLKEKRVVPALLVMLSSGPPRLRT